MQCKATASKTGKQCRRTACPGTNYCYIHAVATSPALVNPRFINGRHTEHLPAGLLATYRATLQDEQLLDLKSEIALIDSQVNYLLARRKHDSESLEELLDGDPEAYEKKQTAVDKREAVDYGKLIDLLEARRRMVETEMKRRTLTQSLVPIEQVMALFGQITDVIKRNVVDRPTLRNIEQDLAEILDSAGAPRTSRSHG